MAKVYAQLDDRLRKFILAQPIFFVATAPCLSAAGDGGHVNVSPKGYRDTFAILGPRTVAYLDLTGSGAETIAHLRQNGRITIMFCSFDRSPKIVRLYGTGRVVLPADPDWLPLAAHFGDGTGQIPDGQPKTASPYNSQPTDSQPADSRAWTGARGRLDPQRPALQQPQAGRPARGTRRGTPATGGRSSSPNSTASPIVRLRRAGDGACRRA